VTPQTKLSQPQSIQDSLRLSAEEAFERSIGFIDWYVKAAKRLQAAHGYIAAKSRKAMLEKAWKEAAKRQPVVQLSAFR